MWWFGGPRKYRAKEKEMEKPLVTPEQSPGKTPMPQKGLISLRPTPTFPVEQL